MIHGVDEKVSVLNMVKGTEIISDIVRRFCT